MCSLFRVLDMLLSSLKYLCDPQMAEADPETSTASPAGNFDPGIHSEPETKVSTEVQLVTEQSPNQEVQPDGKQRTQSELENLDRTGEDKEEEKVERGQPRPPSPKQLHKGTKVQN